MHVGHDPDQQPGRRRDRDRPPQYEQGAVKNRTDDHLADLGTPVGRQFEGERGRHPFQDGFREKAGDEQGHQDSQQDHRGEQHSREQGGPESARSRR